MADEPGLGHSLLLGGAAIFGGLALFGIYASWVPECQEFYRAADLQLPLPTTWMLGLAGLTARFWFVILPIVILGPIPPALLMGRGTGQRILAHMAVIQLMVALFTIAALYMPMYKLSSHLSDTTSSQRPASGASSTAASPTSSSPTAAPR